MDESEKETNKKINNEINSESQNDTNSEIKNTSDNRRLINETFRMAWPSVIESFFVAFVGMVDSMMVSELGPYAVAAVGLTVQPKFIGLSVFFAVNMAVSALVAWRKGENNRKSANQVFITAAFFTVAAGIIISVLCMLLAGPIMHLVGSEADTHGSAVSYFRIIMGGILFTAISLVINAAQRGAGNTKIAMRTNLVSNLVNVIFNYLLISGKLGFPAMGVRGAAIATVLGSAVGCGMSIQSLFNKDSLVRIPYLWEQKIRPAVEAGKQICQFAYNALIEQILLRFGFLIVSILTANLGTAAFALQQVGMNVMALSFSFGDGMQVAAVSLIGQSLGKGKPELAKRYGNICQRMGNVISVVLSILYLIGGRWFFGLYFDEPELVATGVEIMRLMVFIVLMQIAQVIYMGCLRGAGDVRFTALISLVGVAVMRPLSSYILAYPMGLGVIGIWLGCICDQLLRLCLSAWRFRSGKWMKLKL